MANVQLFKKNKHNTDSKDLIKIVRSLENKQKSVPVEKADNLTEVEPGIEAVWTKDFIVKKTTKDR